MNKCAVLSLFKNLKLRSDIQYLQCCVLHYSIARIMCDFHYVYITILRWAEKNFEFAREKVNVINHLWALKARWIKLELAFNGISSLNINATWRLIDTGIRRMHMPILIEWNYQKKLWIGNCFIFMEKEI